MSIATIQIANLPFALGTRRKLFRIILFFLSAILVAFALKIPAKAGESRTLIIPSNDGYGFEECLKAGSPCGMVVADAWCKAHGFAASKAFGPADAETQSDVTPGSVHVICGDRVD
jgi:hypothetical protein